MVSPYQEWPIEPQTLNLSWFNDIQYWGTLNGYNENGSTLYTDYWSRYISSLYNKYSRRVTAYFVLNNVDLNSFEFKDTIFVNGVHYRPEKIIDVQIGAYTEVKVQLLTANDYAPPVAPTDDEPIIIIILSGGGCETTPSITAEYSGTPPFSWSLSNGVSGKVLQDAEKGLSPYEFTIKDLTPGTYTLDIKDALGRSGSTEVVIPDPVVSFPEATFEVVEPTICTLEEFGTPCNGEILVSPAEGVSPYTIEWDSPEITGFNPTNVCAGTYSFIVFDANGCPSSEYVVEVECDTEGYTIWNYAQDLNCVTLSDKFIKVRVPVGTTPDPLDVVTLEDLSTGLDIEGCYRAVNETTGTPTHEVSFIWDNCDQCQGIEPPDPSGYVIILDCNEELYYEAVNTYDNVQGDIVFYEVHGEEGIYRCGTVKATFDVGIADSTIIDGVVYQDCDQCEEVLPSNPYGLRIPFVGEWNSERLNSFIGNNTTGAYNSFLKLPAGGRRSTTFGNQIATGTGGFYWSSTAPNLSSDSRAFITGSSVAFIGDQARANGFSVRLIVDGTFTLQQFNDNYKDKTWTYQGLSYKFVYSVGTGKIWLDRNLGAERVATSINDAMSYGNQYQWGRGPDGYEKRLTSGAWNGSVLGFPSTAKESGGWDGNFILTTAMPFDWLDPQNRNLWQGVNGFNESFL
jgi:hypothetical protein